MLKVAVDFDTAMYGGGEGSDVVLSSEDEEEEPEVARPQLKAVVIADLPAEDLKAGDKVAYSDDTFVMGSAMGRRETVVMEVRPSNKQYPLVLANGAVLNRGDFLRRRATISVDDDGEPNGYDRSTAPNEPAPAFDPPLSPFLRPNSQRLHHRHRHRQVRGARRLAQVAADLIIHTGGEQDRRRNGRGALEARDGEDDGKATGYSRPHHPRQHPYVNGAVVQSLKF